MLCCNGQPDTLAVPISKGVLVLSCDCVVTMQHSSTHVELHGVEDITTILSEQDHSTHICRTCVVFRGFSSSTTGGMSDSNTCT